MNQYANIDEMWMDVVTDLINAKRQPSRVGGTREIIGWSGQLLSCDYTILRNSRRALSVPYAVAELVWYLSGSDSVAMMEPYAPSYGSYVGSTSHAYGAYGKRLQRGDVLNTVAEILRQAPESRQAVALIWTPNDLQVAAKNGPDIPCTISLQFLLRDKRLHCVTNMRSNDAWLGMPYDIFCFTSIQRLLAGELGMMPGTYTHNVGSMHLYDRNYVAARSATEIHGLDREYDGVPVWSNYASDNLTDFHQVIAAELFYRGGNNTRFTASHAIGPMHSDLIEVFRCFWSKAFPGLQQFNSKIIEQGMQRWKRSLEDSQS